MELKFLRSTFGMILVIVVLTFVAYSFMVSDSYKTLDDGFSIVNNPRIKSFSYLGEVMTRSFFGAGSYYRPLVTISFMIEYHFFGLSPYYYYLTNIFIHILTAIGLFWIIRIIFREQTLAFLVALLFAIHPIQWESVANIPGRSILLSSFFVVSAFLCYLLGRDKRFFYFLSLVLFVLGLLSKEAAGVLPLMLVSYQYFLERKPKKALHQTFYPVIPFFAVSAVYIIVRRLLEITNFYYWRSFYEALLGFLTFLRSVVTHLRLFILPYDLHFDRGSKLFESVFNIEIFLTIMFFILLVAFLWQWRKRISNKGKFFMSWFCIQLLPVCQVPFSIGVRPGYISTAEHFLYLASVGIFVLMAQGILWAYQKNKEYRIISPDALSVLMAVVFGVFFLITIQSNIYASSEMAMYQRTLKYNPANSRIRYNLGLNYASRGFFKEAEDEFRKILEDPPEVVHVRIALGKALCDQGKLWEGIREYEAITDAGGMAPLLRNNLNASYYFLEMRYWQQLREDPGNADLYYSLGTVYYKQGHFDKAIHAYLDSIERKSNFTQALYNLAVSFEAAGKPKEAIPYYDQVIALGSHEELMGRARARLAVIQKNTP